MTEPQIRAAYDLCIYLGELHPDHLLAKLTSRQWTGWLAYLSQFPLPHDRADLNTALARATALNCGGAKRVNVERLVPAYGKLRTVKSEKQMKAAAMAWATKAKR